MHKKKALIEIPFAGLAQGTREFDFTCTVHSFNDQQLIDTGFKEDVQVHATTKKSERHVTVIIETSAVAEFSCDICLAPILKVLTGSFSIYYNNEDSEKTSDNNEEWRFLEKNTVSIDITEDVRETLLLSIPMKVICSDNPECKLYEKTEKDEDPDSENISSWQESLEKLKNKYC